MGRAGGEAAAAAGPACLGVLELLLLLLLLTVSAPRIERYSCCIDVNNLSCNLLVAAAPAAAAFTAAAADAYIGAIYCLRRVVGACWRLRRQVKALQQGGGRRRHTEKEITIFHARCALAFGTHKSRSLLSEQQQQEKQHETGASRPHMQEQGQTLQQKLQRYMQRRQRMSLRGVIQRQREEPKQKRARKMRYHSAAHRQQHADVSAASSKRSHLSEPLFSGDFFCNNVMGERENSGSSLLSEKFAGTVERSAAADAGRHRKGGTERATPQGRWLAAAFIAIVSAAVAAATAAERAFGRRDRIFCQTCNRDAPLVGFFRSNCYGGEEQNLPFAFLPPSPFWSSSSTFLRVFPRFTLRFNVFQPHRLLHRSPQSCHVCSVARIGYAKDSLFAGATMIVNSPVPVQHKSPVTAAAAAAAAKNGSEFSAAPAAVAAGFSLPQEKVPAFAAYLGGGLAPRMTPRSTLAAASMKAIAAACTKRLAAAPTRALAAGGMRKYDAAPTEAFAAARTIALAAARAHTIAAGTSAVALPSGAATVVGGADAASIEAPATPKPGNPALLSFGIRTSDTLEKRATDLFFFKKEGQLAFPTAGCSSAAAALTYSALTLVSEHTSEMLSGHVSQSLPSEELSGHAARSVPSEEEAARESNNFWPGPATAAAQAAAAASGVTAAEAVHPSSDSIAQIPAGESSVDVCTAAGRCAITRGGEIRLHWEVLRLLASSASSAPSVRLHWMLSLRDRAKETATAALKTADAAAESYGVGTVLLRAHHNRARNKLGRPYGHRRCLLRNLCTQLLRYGSVTTTFAKAKECKRSTDKLLMLCKQPSLHTYRQALAFLYDKRLCRQLFLEAPERFKHRPHGFCRIQKMTFCRLGDNAEMARVELLD